MATKRQWSEAQKLQIIQEVEKNSLTETLRKYNLSSSLFHKWRKRYNGEGMEGLKPATRLSIRKLSNYKAKMRGLNAS